VELRAALVHPLVEGVGDELGAVVDDEPIAPNNVEGFLVLRSRTRGDSRWGPRGSLPNVRSSGRPSS
jgi:hypothetical protein